MEEKRSHPRPVRCIDTGIVYKHCTDAAIQLGTIQCSIQKVCGHPNRTWRGMHFEYVDTPLNRNLLTGNRTGRVMCLETGVVYESAADASRKLGAVVTAISVVVNLRNRTWHGLHFKYINE